MKTYVGYRRRMTRDDWLDLGWQEHEANRLVEEAPGVTHTTVAVVSEDGVYALPHHVCHSPTGFEWGYHGSGPSELARCILIDHLGLTAEQLAQRRPVLPVSYQDFKVAFVAELPRDEPWSITSEQIDEWIVER